MTPTQHTTSAALKDAIREAGGIVHSDGNIFFTSAEQFTEAALAASAPVAPTSVDVDELAQFIRETDGSNSMGAGALAEKILGWLEISKAAPVAPAPQPAVPGMTAAEINALPEKARNYIHQLATNADPAGMVRENMQLRDVNEGLQLMYRRAFAEGVEASAKMAENHTGRPCAGEVLAHAIRSLAAAPKAGPQPEPASIHLQDLKNALADVAELRQQLRLLEDYAGNSVWRWQADGADHLESMGARMSVLIYASDLRALLTAPPAPSAQDAADWLVGAGVVTDDIDLAQRLDIGHNRAERLFSAARAQQKGGEPA